MLYRFKDIIKNGKSVLKNNSRKQAINPVISSKLKYKLVTYEDRFKVNRNQQKSEENQIQWIVGKHEYKTVIDKHTSQEKLIHWSTDLEKREILLRIEASNNSILLASQQAHCAYTVAKLIKKKADEHLRLAELTENTIDYEKSFQVYMTASVILETDEIKRACDAISSILSMNELIEQYKEFRHDEDKSAIFFSNIRLDQLGVDQVDLMKDRVLKLLAAGKLASDLAAELLDNLSANKLEDWKCRRYKGSI